ncbi:MAG: hypothetical protein ACI8V2_004894, partial [Candidatus Latescibacterota bacterium]
ASGRRKTALGFIQQWLFGYNRIGESKHATT